MATHRYTNEELRHLRSSPLVKKPDRLPPIEQWIDESQQTTTTQVDKTARTLAGRVPRSTIGGDKSPMGNFSTGQRPSLLQTRTGGSRSGDDFMTNLPKTAFTSSRSISRLTSFGNEPSTSDSAREESDGRVRPPSDRQHVRKNTSTFDRENWSTVRDRRALEEAEHSRTDGTSERNLRQSQKDREGDKSESRWPSKDDRRPNGERQGGGWRDREANRRDRGWDRNEHNEREPEWFDEPASAKQDDDFAGMSQARTQEDFQKWKAMMNNNNNKPQDETKVQQDPVHAPTAAKKEPDQKPVESLKLEGVNDRPFGSFSGVKSPDSAAAQSSKGKASRFASMFKKDDTPLVPEPEQHPPPPLPAASAPPVMPTQESREDKEGFQRILQMLGGTNINTGVLPTPAEPRSPPRSSASGARQKSRFFDSTKSPDNFAAAQLQVSESAPSTQAQTAPKTAHASSPVPPNGEASIEQQHRSRPPHERATSSYQGGASTPDINIQNLLANQRAQRPPTSSKDSEFLLGLLQGHSTRPHPQVSHPQPDFPLWLGPQADTHGPKPRAPPPPGHLDDQLLRNGPHDPQRGPQQSREQYDEKSVPPQMPRAPPGFDDQARLMQVLQQRNIPELASFPPQQFDPAQQRRPPGLPPGMPMPPHAMHHQQMGAPLPTQPPNDLPYMQPPPPGLPPHLRHPQGFANIPNIFQAPQQQMSLQPHFAQGPPPHMLPNQQNGGIPPGLIRNMPLPNNGPAPPGFGANGPNGAYGRGQQSGIYDQRRYEKQEGLSGVVQVCMYRATSIPNDENYAPTRRNASSITAREDEVNKPTNETTHHDRQDSQQIVVPWSTVVAPPLTVRRQTMLHTHAPEFEFSSATCPIRVNLPMPPSNIIGSSTQHGDGTSTTRSLSAFWSLLDTSRQVAASSNADRKAASTQLSTSRSGSSAALVEQLCSHHRGGDYLSASVPYPSSPHTEQRPRRAFSALGSLESCRTYKVSPEGDTSSSEPTNEPRASDPSSDLLHRERYVSLSHGNEQHHVEAATFDDDDDADEEYPVYSLHQAESFGSYRPRRSSPDSLITKVKDLAAYYGVPSGAVSSSDGRKPGPHRSAADGDIGKAKATEDRATMDDLQMLGPQIEQYTSKITANPIARTSPITVGQVPESLDSRANRDQGGVPVLRPELRNFSARGHHNTSSSAESACSAAYFSVKTTPRRVLRSFMRIRHSTSEPGLGTSSELEHIQRLASLRAQLQQENERLDIHHASHGLSQARASNSPVVAWDDTMDIRDLPFLSVESWLANDFNYAIPQGASVLSEAERAAILDGTRQQIIEPEGLPYPRSHVHAYNRAAAHLDSQCSAPRYWPMQVRFREMVRRAEWNRLVHGGWPWNDWPFNWQDLAWLDAVLEQVRQERETESD